MLRWLGAIVFLGLILRFGAWALVHPSPPVEEEAIYVNRAILQERALTPTVDDQRAPGVLFFYQFLAACLGKKLVLFRLANLILGTLFLVVFFFWCRTLVSPRIALGAVFLAAIHPELVFYSVSLWSESLYLLVLYLAFWMYLRWNSALSFRRAILLGILFGAVALVREIGLFLAVAIVLGWVIRRTFSMSMAARAAVFFAAFVLTILPWSIHLSRRSGQLVLISGMNERRLYVGNVPFSGVDPRGALATRHGIALDSYWKLSKNPPERRHLARQAVAQSIREQLPSWPFEKVRDELPKFFTPNSFPAARLLAHPEDRGWAGKWAYRFSNPSLDRRGVGSALGIITVSFHVATMLLGAAGIALLPFGGASLPLIGFSAAHLLPTLATTACSRYRLPLTPLFLLGSAALLFDGRNLWAHASSRRRALTVAMAILAGAILLARARFVFPPQYG